MNSAGNHGFSVYLIQKQFQNLERQFHREEQPLKAFRMHEAALKRIFSSDGQCRQGAEATSMRQETVSTQRSQVESDESKTEDEEECAANLVDNDEVAAPDVTASVQKNQPSKEEIERITSSSTLLIERDRQESPRS